MIHYKFQLIPGSYLDLIRRCTALTCLGHCICSPKYKRCHLNGDVCADVTTGIALQCNRHYMLGMAAILLKYYQMINSFHQLTVVYTIRQPKNQFESRVSRDIESSKSLLNVFTICVIL